MKLSEIQNIFQKGLQSVVELINSLYAQITELKNKISELETKNKELAEQKAKDSHNSSKPSSTDGFKKKTKILLILFLSSFSLSLFADNASIISIKDVNNFIL